MIKLNNLLTEAETFTATNKKTGKTSVFGSKDSRDSAIKAGTHSKSNDKGGDASKKTSKPTTNIFNTPAEEPKADTPTSEPKKKRPGNPKVNKDAKKLAEKSGITPQKLGNEKYKEAMFQAAVSALTDSNFHSEARELVAAIEGKPEFAKKPEYPSIKDPKYKEKMDDIRKNSADGSVYMNGTGAIDDYGTDVSQASGWDGVDAADGIAFTLRMNGFHKEADLIQSVFDNKPYMKNEGRISLSKMVNEDLLDIIPYFKKKREAAAKKLADIHYTRKELAYNNVKAVYDTTIKALDNPKYSQDKDAKIKACNDLIWTIVSGSPKNEKVNWNKLKASYDWDELNEFGMMDTIEQTFADLLKTKDMKNESTKLKKISESIINEGTRSQVGVINPSGKIISAYVHFDGYPSNMKPGLTTHMKSAKDVMTLIKNGGARYIIDDKPIEYYKQGKPLKGDIANIKDYIRTAGTEAWADYVYLYNMKDNHWYYSKTEDAKLKKL